MNQGSLITLLPPELCNQLCGYLDPNSIVSLLSLDRHVRQKLIKGGGIKDLELVFPPNSHPPAWPAKFISQFPDLRSLTLSLPGKTETTHFPMKMLLGDVKALPRKLQRLALIFQSDLLNSAIEHLPPTLQTLIIPICTTLTDACFGLLPRTLVHLELPKVHRVTDGDALASLPPNLLCLNLAAADITGVGAAKLPHSLTSLSLEKNIKLASDALGHLPPHLSELKAIRALARMTDRDAEHLPIYLRSLHLGYNNYITDCGIAKLPRTLEHFQSTWNEKVSVLAFRLLPSSLRSLNVGWPNISDLSFHDLPKNLISLHLDSAAVTDACLSLLPSTLRSLTILSAMDISNTGLRALKVPLVTLSLPSALLTPDCLAYVPRTVQNLSLRKTLWPELRRNDLAHLPPLLASLDVGNNEFLTEDALELLPRGLTSFVAPLLEIRTPARLADLPPNLTRLRLLAHPNLSEALWAHISPHMRYLYLPGVTHKPRVVPSFPPYLKELTFTIAWPDESPLDPKEWGPLPSSLVFIRCTSNRCYRRTVQGEWKPVDQPFGF
jgi:hypothetical protein